MPVVSLLVADTVIAQNAASTSVSTVSLFLFRLRRIILLDALCVVKNSNSRFVLNRRFLHKTFKLEARELAVLLSI